MQPDESTVHKLLKKNFTDAMIRIGLIVFLVVMCFRIFAPFANIMLWALILAVTLYPLHQQLAKRLKGRQGRAAVILVLAGILLIAVPSAMIGGSFARYIHKGYTAYQNDSITIKQPDPKVADWPLVGERVHDFWDLASDNLEVAVTRIAPRLEGFGKWVLSAGAGVGIGVLQFVISIVIAGALLANSESGAHAAQMIAHRLNSARGAEFIDLARATVRSVAQGVLGVASIQGLLAGIGLLTMGVPGAGLWAALVLLLAVVQLPPLLVLGPIMIYVFNTADTVPAVLFTLWSLLVSTSDAFLKPLLLGRGLQTPMLVILIGAIGGMIVSGIIGLFIGSVILALGYELFMAWVKQDPELDSEQPESERSPAGGHEAP